jgi:selenide,water dikinase
MGPGALAQVLRPLAQRHDVNVLVGLQTSDDAAVYRLNDDLAMVQTVDFFTPVVDDPYTYGAIAAANALSDVYAMGGDVLMALNIAALPEDLPFEVIQRIFEGGADKVAEAGIVIAGGHTVTDEEPKYGLVVTGTIHPSKILTKAGAKTGDILFLTKPIGIGVITTALKAQAAEPEHVEAAIQSMLRLNRVASRLMREVGVNAATDITGYGLIGHTMEVVEKSGVQIRLAARRVPLLDGAERYAREGRLPGGGGRNVAYYTSLTSPSVTIEPDVPRALADLMFDPQTSGGLLISVSQERAAQLEAAFRDANEPIWQIGTVEEGFGLVVTLD